MKAKKKITRIRQKTTKAALKLLRDPAFLFRVGKRIGDLGIVGEERNRLILFLACLTKHFHEAVSVLVKGITSGGKSKLVRTILRLMPPEDVTSLASLSKMAPVYGQGTLDGKILYVAEYRGGRDAQYLIRLQQSEGEIRHEYATVRGSRRSTK